MKRQRIIATNWKMNHLSAEAEAYAKHLADLDSVSQIVIFPQAALLTTFQSALVRYSRSEAVELGGQDVHPDRDGAHTGDHAAELFADLGALWGLCGHSERRRDHQESDFLVGKKVQACLRSGLQPMLCLGESLADREAGTTETVLSQQLEAAFPTDSGPLTLAYEPVWAIGTGKTATPEMAQEAHAFLRQKVNELGGLEASEGLRILYGGSVKPANCEALIAEPDIDGFLIGGAGLDPSSFLDIIRRSDATP